MIFTYEFAKFINKNKLERLPENENDALLIKAQNGDESAINEFLWRNIGLIMWQMKKHPVNQRYDCFDVFQVLTIAFFEAIRRKDERGSFSNVFALTARRQLLNLRKDMHFEFRVTHCSVSDFESNSPSSPKQKELMTNMTSKKLLRLDKPNQCGKTPDIAIQNFSIKSDFEIDDEATILKIRGILNEREFIVLTEKHGIIDGVSKTLDEVSKMIERDSKYDEKKKLRDQLEKNGISGENAESIIGQVNQREYVTRERVRQIELTAVRKIMRSSFGRELQEKAKGSYCSVK